MRGAELVNDKPTLIYMPQATRSEEHVIVTNSGRWRRGIVPGGYKFTSQRSPQGNPGFRSKKEEGGDPESEECPAERIQRTLM